MKRKFFIKVGIIILAIYAVCTIINQQRTLKQYTKESEILAKKIEEEKSNNSELNDKMNNVNSLEFIEEKAREMLDMYYPNERIYINKGM